MPPPRRIGSDFEDKAADYLLSLGWTVLGRRLKMPHGELDIVAMDGEALVFVEVKSRADGFAADAVTPKKQQHLAQAAMAFCQKFGLSPESPMRFDVITFQGETMSHHQSALQDLD